MKIQEKEKVHEEKKGQENTLEKRPYKTPRLEKLGNVKKMTEGAPGPTNDPGDASVY